jgi:hypothetical protein
MLYYIECSSIVRQTDSHTERERERERDGERHHANSRVRSIYQTDLHDVATHHLQHPLLHSPVLINGTGGRGEGRGGAPSMPSLPRSQGCKTNPTVSYGKLQHDEP